MSGHDGQPIPSLFHHLQQLQGYASETADTWLQLACSCSAELLVLEGWNEEATN